jgi:hypothetical protein
MHALHAQSNDPHTNTTARHPARTPPQAETALPPLRTHPKLVAALLGTLALGGVWAYRWAMAAM